jgi:hypothetical protein
MSQMGQTRPILAGANGPTMSALPRKRRGSRGDAICREGPCVDGSGLASGIFTLRRWSERPCVRPVDAVHMTAGHNALRGSGPDQKHAFEDAMAHVGCPDRRIDRRCIKCCSPPNRYVTPDIQCNLVSSRRESGGFIVTFVPGHHCPSHPGDFVGERDGSDLGGSPCQQCGEPRPMPGTMDLGIADHGERASREQAAQIAIALLADTAKLVLAPARVLLRYEPNPGREVSSRSEGLGISNAGDQSCCQRRPDAGDRVQPFARRQELQQRLPDEAEIRG